MSGNKLRVLKPREAEKLAVQLGWTVEPKRRSGDLIFRSPDGRRFTSRAAGRTERVPLALAKALLRVEGE